MLLRIRDFIKLEAASGIVLLLMTLLALMLANSPLKNSYYEIFSEPLIAQKTLLFCINEGLMAVFFLLVGLEIKREIVQGELNTKAKISLPAICALGGMAFPALIYTMFNYHQKTSMQGWAIPTATDIAFAVGLLTLFGKRIPASLKAFLLALAILDDLGAIGIIAIFYSVPTVGKSMLLSGVCILLLFIFNQIKVTRLWPYIVTGGLLWFCILQTGIHATLAGVILACFIPLKNSALQFLEKCLHPWVSFGILPLFALANAGVDLSIFSRDSFLKPLPLGIILGLCIGKQLGIFLTAWLWIKGGYANLPRHATWQQFYGIAILCGIGFTMSIFISDLAFNQVSADYLNLAKISVFIGSLCAGIIAYLCLAANSHLQRH